MRRLLALPLILLAACGGGSGSDGGPPEGGCAPEERVAEQSGGHLVGDAEPTQPYNSVPPTSGWHSAGAPRYGVHTAEDPLSEPEQVTVLELGGIVLTYHEVEEQQRAALEAFAAQHDKVAVTPYDKLQPGEVAMTAWGVLRRCDGLDRQVVERFIDVHEGRGADH